MDKNFFVKCIEEKANLIIVDLEQNMYIRKFDWAHVLSSNFHYAFLII